jgi:hypothetical protein
MSMNRHWILRSGFGLLLSLGAGSAIAGEAPPQLRDHILALTQQLMDAICDGKADVWQRVLADDAVIIDEFGRKQDKAEAVKSMHALPAGFSGSIQVRDAHVHVYGAALVADFEGYEKEQVFDQLFVVRYIFTATYVQQKDEWKLAALEDVTLPTEPPRLAVADIKLDDYVGSYRYGPDRAYAFSVNAGTLEFTTKAGRKPTSVRALARDVFMDDGDEKNVLVFRRDDTGRVNELIERRKFNDLHLKREAAKPAG